MAKLSEMTPEEAGRKLYDAYMSAHERYVDDPDGTEGSHPSKDVARWREAAAGAPVEDEDETAQPSKTAGGNSGSGGAVPAQDGVYSESLDGTPKFERADGVTLVGDAAIEAYADAVDPRKVARMKAAIKGY